LKILLIGDDLIVQRFKRALQEEEIDVVDNPELLSIPGLIEQNEYDLAIIDFAFSGARTISNRIADLALMPVVVIMDQNEESWKIVPSFNADAFVPEDSSNAEIFARIKAVYRRSMRNQLTIAG